LRRQLAQRQVILAAVAILAVAVAVASVTHRDDHHRLATRLPPPHGSYTALAAASGESVLGHRTSCGVLVGDATMGIGSPVVPCGSRLYLTYGNRHVLASVIDEADFAGASLVLTHALARRLGVSGVRRIRWSYAGS
jgi:hypothetical protein